jgi:hypothetical protein
MCIKTNKYTNYSFSLFIMVAPTCFDITLPLRGDLISPRTTSLDNTPIRNILLTVPHLSISQKALGTLPEDGNLMPKHTGNAIRN